MYISKLKKEYKVPQNGRRNFLGKLGLASVLLGAVGSAYAVVPTQKKELKKEPIWDPYDFGAVGDGKTTDTKAIQAAIDQCYYTGGGMVVLHSGVFMSGTIILKSSTCLHIEAGTTLLGSKNLDDYPDIDPEIRYLYSGRFTRYLIYAEKAENISITGNGTIDGNGREFPYIPGEDKNRPYILRFSECKNIRVQGITFLDSARWLQHYLACENLTIDGITVISQTRENRDGIDIDSCDKVRISNCSIDAGDDAIVLKATAIQPCKNVTVSNCVLRSKAAGLKLGTESNGGFENIVFTGCTIYDTEEGDAIAIEMVDGGRLERITVSNIVIHNARAAIFIRLGDRARPIPGLVKPGKGSMRDVIINNIQATGISKTGCSITGLPGQAIENVILSNIQIRFAGGGTNKDAQREIPERAEAYPMSDMFGILPAYGFFCRHVKNIAFNNIQTGFEKQDTRPAFHGEDIRGLSVVGYNAGISPEAEAYFVFKEVEDAIISGCRPLGESNVFLQVKGTSSENISLFGNDFTKVKQVVDSHTTMDKQITIGVNATRYQK